MGSRERILSAVSRSQPAPLPMPLVPSFGPGAPDLVEVFTSMAVAVGGRAFRVKGYRQVQEILGKEFGPGRRIVSAVPELAGFADTAPLAEAERHQLADVDLAIVGAHFGVAENGAVWVTEERLGLRALPFICQHLAVLLPKDRVLPLMHDAYARIGAAGYGYGVFIAGPSKTADIEQSLVLGAHGPRTMTVFLLDENAPD